MLLLDEATSALDADSEFQVQKAIDQLIAKGDMTVIIIAHRLSTIQKANAIAVIVDGRVVEKGSHAELLAKEDGHYTRLVDRQMKSSN